MTVAAATALPAQTNLVIVSGLGGQPAYTKQFTDLSVALANAARTRAALPDSAILWFGETAASPAPWHRGQSTKVNVEAALRRLAARPGDEQTVIVLIGHGSGERETTRISLPGADLTTQDFARLLDAFGTRRVAFVNLTSASGDMAPLLAGPSRVVLTATKSAFERNESQFARFFVDAFAKDGADTDKDARVSLLEAFKYAEAETKRFYETDGKLSTETAQIADESRLANRFFLTAGAANAAATGRLATLYQERSVLDDQIEALKAKKSSMTSDAYDNELETILLQLARKSSEIRQLERGS